MARMDFFGEAARLLEDIIAQVAFDGGAAVVEIAKAAGEAVAQFLELARLPAVAVVTLIALGFVPRLDGLEFLANVGFQLLETPPVAFADFESLLGQRFLEAREAGLVVAHLRAE